MLVEVLEYTAKRIKNEAGPYNFPVHYQIRDMISSKFVAPTLESGDKDSAQSVATCLVQILQRDLERRDFVAKGYFEGITASILESALNFDPRKKQMDVRTIWIQCSIQISWILSKASGSAQNFKFPLQNSRQFLPVTNWIRNVEFDNVFPYREYPSQLAKMQEQVHLPEVVNFFDVDQVFGPNDAVQLMVNALQDVWDKRITSSMPLELEPYLPNEKETANVIMHRLEHIFSLGSIHFEDSDFLTQAFDHLYGAPMKNAPKDHFLLAEELLKTIISTMSPSYFFEHERLAKAIDTVFRYTVQNNLYENTMYWLEYMKKVEMLGLQSSLQHVDKRLLRTIVQYNWAPYVKGYDKKPTTNRMCSFANKMLTITSSALIHPDVNQIVFQHRPDIVLQFCKTGKLEGIFQKNKKDIIDGIALVYNSISVDKVENFPPKLASLYASYAYQCSLDDSRNIATRILAMERYTTCPTISNANILHVLADETLEPPLLEAITLRIFSLDSLWYVDSKIHYFIFPFLLMH